VITLASLQRQTFVRPCLYWHSARIFISTGGEKGKPRANASPAIGACNYMGRLGLTHPG
jgi:hypothetical protein